jgi:hypothetical protein
VKNLSVGEPQHSESLVFDKRLAYLVFLISVIVNRTVDFDNQPRFGAVEIDNELTYSVLPPEPEPVEASST